MTEGRLRSNASRCTLGFSRLALSLGDVNNSAVFQHIGGSSSKARQFDCLLGGAAKGFESVRHWLFRDRRGLPFHGLSPLARRIGVSPELSYSSQRSTSGR